MAAETSPPSAPDPDDKSDEQSSSVPLWLVVLAVLALASALGIILYWGHVGKPWWEGDSDKKFWDYLELLIVPAALALGVYWLNRRETARQDQAQAERERERQKLEARRERERKDDAAQRERERVATEEARRKRERETQAAQRKRELDVENQRAQDAALQAYLDQMSQLLLDKDRPLRETKEGDEARTLARARTITVLPRLNSDRKRSVVQFLFESSLIAEHRVLDLTEADLSGADLRQTRPTDLRGANLSETNLIGANLSGTYLVGADLSGTDLIGAYMRGAYLKGANLQRANLQESNLTHADLIEADLSWTVLIEADLSEATLIEADLSMADLSDTILHAAHLGEANLEGAILERADLRGAKGWTEEQLSTTSSLEGATMPNGQKYEDWLKDREKRQQDE